MKCNYLIHFSKTCYPIPIKLSMPTNITESYQTNQPNALDINSLQVPLSSQIPNSIHQHTSNSSDIINFTVDSQANDDKENFGIINVVKQKSCEDGDYINNNQTQGSQRLDSNNNQTSNYSAFQANINNLGAQQQEDQDQYSSLYENRENPRKYSQAESDLNCEEMKEEEQDIRRQINQKLIKNKNYFMHFMRNQNGMGKSDFGSKFPDGSGFMQMVDKRSRSETPDKMSATEVLLRAHKKLAEAAQRKQSPHKILEKHNQRQKKAEELRSQIEQSKKHWYEKIRNRQQIAKQKWLELLAERKAKLQDKLEQAEERRETEIQSLKNKAKQENLKIDETNFIVKMTMNNMKLDLNSKMNETKERRNHIMEELRKKQHDRAQKEEAAEKRRQELQKSFEHKVQSNQQRREQADQRRSKMIEERKKAAQEAKKRTMVLQRKNDLGEKISDVMSFVNNSENIWEFLGNERDWQELGVFNNSRDESILFELMQKDQIQIEKMKLKKDAEILNQMIIIEENGNIYSNKFLLPLLKKRKNQGFESPTQNSSDDEETEHHSLDKDVDLLLTPERLRRLQQNSPQNRKTTDEESKSQDGGDQPDFISDGDGSDKDSIPEESNLNKELLKDLIPQQEIFTEEIQSYILYTSRLRMSMKRNILKKNLSEDLTWADFLKNESYQYHQQGITSFKIAQTRSMQSTPERKQDISSDIDEKTVSEQTINTDENEKDQIIKNDKQRTSKIGSHHNTGSHKNSNQNQSNPHTSSGSNISDKSRISSVVYPSKNKKTPRNQIETRISHPNPSDPKQFINVKKNSNSNQSSTKSLHLASQQSETPMSINKKIIQMDHDSARKRQGGRLHSSSVQETSTTGFQNIPHTQAHNTSLVDETQIINDKSLFEHQQSFHTGSQMNQLISNTKPVMPTPKLIPKKLTANAVKMLFPIREQKLLFKRPGKEGQFGKFKINVKMEDLSLHKSIQAIIHTQTANQTTLSNPNESIDEKHQSSVSLQQTNLNQSLILQDQDKKESPSIKKSSQNNTPSHNNRRESIESNTLQINTQTSASNLQENLSGTPNQSTSRLLQIQQKFWEKYSNQNQSSMQSDDYNALLKKQQNLHQVLSSSNISDAHQTTPKKESKSSQLTTHHNSDLDINAEQNKSTDSASASMNETGYKELILKYLLTDNVQLLKNEDSQKTISLESSDSDKIIDYLESNEILIRYCRLCDLILPEHCTNEAHVHIKSHKKTRDELGIKEQEDVQFSILSIISQPGDIEKELLREKEKALKRKVKRIKAQMIAQCVTHESASYCPGKEYNSPNKKRLQILCIDLEKQVIPIINNYEALENTLKEIIKILDMRKHVDLHLMRKLKFVPILIEICKRISVCHKNEFKHIGKMLDYVIKIINTFCGLRENRNYMLQTNRMLALVELLNWCLNRPTQLFYGINFMPTLFHILTLHIKHRAPYECQQMKELFIEYLVCSQITMKIKSKFQIINGPLDLSETMGQIPLFLLKSAAFIEALTNLLQIDAISRPVYEKSQKIGDHVLFVIQNTELFGIIPMITTILLSRNQPFKPSQNQQQTISASNKILPQTLLSLAITSVKILNNVLRMDYKEAQQMMSDFEIQEQLYHLFNYLLYYTIVTVDQQEDSKELLHETLLLIGYFTLNNEKHQQILCKGESTLIQKLCNMPFTYFCDKKMKEILFPTLIQASYKNERCLAIMDQEISIDLIVDFIQLNLKEELPKIVEEKDEYQSISSFGGLGGLGGNMGAALDHRTRSPSQSSASSQCSLQIDIVNGNSPFLPLYMRFPKKLWKDAIQFYSQVLY